MVSKLEFDELNLIKFDIASAENDEQLSNLLDKYYICRVKKSIADGKLKIAIDSETVANYTLSVNDNKYDGSEFEYIEQIIDGLLANLRIKLRENYTNCIAVNPGPGPAGIYDFTLSVENIKNGFYKKVHPNFKEPNQWICVDV